MNYDTVTVPRDGHRLFTIGDGGAFENTLIDISAPGATFRIEAYGSGWAIRNVGVRGQWDVPSDGHEQSISARVDGGAGVIENYYFADGVLDDVFPGLTGIYVQDGHSGTLRVNNVNLQHFPNNAIYAANFAGEGGGTVEVSNSFAAHCLASHFRVSGDGSLVENCVAVGGDRGVWVQAGAVDVRDSDLSGHAANRADGDLVCGRNTSPTDAVANVEGAYFGTSAPGDQPINHPGTINGTSTSGPPRTRPEQVGGVPLDAEAAAGGGGKDPSKRRTYGALALAIGVAGAAYSDEDLLR